MENVLFRERIPDNWKHPIPLFRISLRHGFITYRWRWRGHWYSYMQKL